MSTGLAISLMIVAGLAGSGSVRVAALVVAAVALLGGLMSVLSSLVLKRLRESSSSVGQPRTSDHGALSAGSRRWITILFCAGGLLTAIVVVTGAPWALAVVIALVGFVATMVVIDREVRTRQTPTDRTNGS
jgi:hypothetical protein